MLEVNPTARVDHALASITATATRAEFRFTSEERQVLLDLEMCSNGATNSYAPVATKSGHKGSVPRGVEDRWAFDAPHLTYRGRLIAAAQDPARRARVLTAAKEELRHLRKGQGTRGLSDEQLRQLEDAEIRKLAGLGFSVEEIAMSRRCTAKRVRTALQPGPDGTDAQILDLHRQGKTVRYISTATGISKSTVHRTIKAAA